MGKASRRKRQQLRGQLDPLHDHVRDQTDRLTLPGEDLADNELVCDLCGASNPRWVYPTDETDRTGMGWAACQACYRLVEAGSRTELVRRCVQMQRQRYPALEQVNRIALEKDFAVLHEEFFRHRKESAVPTSEWIRKHGAIPDRGELRERLWDLFAGGAGGDLGTVAPSGDPVLRHMSGPEGSDYYMPEGFTPEQLADPRTIEYIMERVRSDRPVPNIPLTAPVTPVIRQWVGARSFLQATAAIYGECPRDDDLIKPRPSMVMAQMVLEPALRAHPLVLEPEQLNAIDAHDWSFAEAIEYAKMAHLPFEPLYLDFGGHQPVTVNLEAGACRLYGAMVWRSGFFKEPTLAVAPIGGFDYLTGPFANALLAKGIDEKRVIEYVGQRPGKEVHIGEPSYASTRSALRAAGGPRTGTISRRAFEQWRYQPAGICWFGVSDTTAQHIPEVDRDGAYLTGIQQVAQGDRLTPVPLTFTSGLGLAEALGEERLLQGGAQAMVLSGLGDPATEATEGTGEVSPDEPYPGWYRMARGATEMVARLAERALLGLYFIESAPIHVEEVALSRPERREQERHAQKGRGMAPVASIIVIDRPRSDSTRTATTSDRNYAYRWERRGHFAHYHSNNRHYQLRPDLVRPCHKCSYEYELNERARHNGQDIPYPYTESPDCVRHWREPAICGPEDKPLRKKVRVRRTGPPTKETA